MEPRVSLPEWLMDAIIEMLEARQFLVDGRTDHEVAKVLEQIEKEVK